MAKIIENEECHRNNLGNFRFCDLDLVPDPFHRMIFAEHLCETLSKSHWFLEIKLEGIAFNLSSGLGFKRESIYDVKFNSSGG